MGIHDLTKFIKTKFPHTIHYVYLSDFSNTRIAIDIMGWIHQTVMTANSTTVRRDTNILHSTQHDNHSKNIVIVLNSLRNYIKTFLDHKITPVFVVDGKSPVLKQETQKSRNKQRDNRKQKSHELKQEIKKEYSKTKQLSKERIDELKKIEKNNVDVKPYMEPIKQLITSLGIPYIQSLTEGEKTCSMMVEDGVCEAVISKDSDCIMLSPVVIRHFLRPDEVKALETPIQKYSNKTITELKEIPATLSPVCEVVIRDEILSKLEMTKESFTKFCILCGCDYNTNGSSSCIYRYGAATLYKEYKQLIDNLQKDILNKLNSGKHKKFETVIDVMFKDMRTKQNEQFEEFCEENDLDFVDIMCSDTQEDAIKKIPSDVKKDFDKIFRCVVSYDKVRMKDCYDILKYEEWYNTVDVYCDGTIEKVKLTEEEHKEITQQLLDIGDVNDSMLRTLMEKYNIRDFSFISRFKKSKTVEKDVDM